MTDYERHLMRVQTPSGGELVISGKEITHGPTLCSAAKAKRYLQQGCHGFLSYVADTRVERKTELSGVPIVRDIPDVFPKDLARVPPERQVEFQITLVPDAAPISKAPYRLATLELQELSMQLWELLDKGFIHQSCSL